MAHLRRRPPGGSDLPTDMPPPPAGQKVDRPAGDYDLSSRKSVLPAAAYLREPVWLMVLALNAALLLYVHSANSHFPAPVTTANAAGRGEFVEERARRNLDEMTRIGSRTVGSPENEEKVVDYLMGVVGAIRSATNVDVHEVDVDVQQVSGTFTLGFLGEFSSYYENVNNIVVRLSPKGGAEHSLLVNCHYDTAINSTGLMIFFNYRFLDKYVRFRL